MAARYHRLKNPATGAKIYTPVLMAGPYRWLSLVSFRKARNAEAWAAEVEGRLQKRGLLGREAEHYANRLEARLLSLKGWGQDGN